MKELGFDVEIRNAYEMAFHLRHRYDVLTTKEMNKGVLLPNLYIRSISNLYPCKKVRILINESFYSDIDQIAPPFLMASTPVIFPEFSEIRS